MMSNYDSGGTVKDASLRDRFVDAFKGLGDKRVLYALNYYVTMEIKMAKSDLANFATRQINSCSIQNGTGGSFMIPLQLPIQFPEINIISVHTSVKCPASSALEDITGQKFGMDADQWARWIAKQK